MAYEHLRVLRQEPINVRKKRQGFGRPAPLDPRGYGTLLVNSFHAVTAQPPEPTGFDRRRLLKIRVTKGIAPEILEAIPGIELVSQEDETIILAFGSAAGLEEVERRLTRLARDGNVTRKDILFAIEGFDSWTPADRTGTALEQLGLPNPDGSIVDIELWPLERNDQRRIMHLAFRRFLADQGVQIYDELDKPSLLLFRVNASQIQLQRLLAHRDVRLVDLPPRYGLATNIIRRDLQQFPEVQPPDRDASFVAVLDSGIVQNHPMLGPALGEALGFLEPQFDTVDISGHGTRVSGIAVYDNVAACVEAESFVPEIRLLSGKVFNDDQNDSHTFVEKSVEAAVRYFVQMYNCKVFCLSYGDLNKVYDGRHVRGLAYILDILARELGVLFVVPTGNHVPDISNQEMLDNYPSYLLNVDARLLDPSTAINCLAVGGIAEYELDENAQRNPNHIESLPIARKNQPAPFTRCGPSIAGAIKPDLVDYAGNMALARTGAALTQRRLGVLSLSSRIAEGHLFDEDCGTSFAAPRVAHCAAKILRYHPELRTDTVRALLAIHAKWPAETVQALDGDRNSILKLSGYGKVDRSFLYQSDDNVVTIVAEDSIITDQHHFYEIPMPADLWSPGKRSREISVALAHTPVVRTTRMDYRSTDMSFCMVKATSLVEVTEWFSRERDLDRSKISEMFTTNRVITSTERERSTLQKSTWNFKMAKDVNELKVFLVVTRKDNNWSANTDVAEPYSIAICLKDIENPHAQLYAQLQAKLQIQERARVRV